MAERLKLHGTQVQTTEVLVAMKEKGRISSGSTFPARRSRSRIHFTVALWIAETALLLLLDRCSGFTSMGYYSQPSMVFPLLYKGQEVKLWHKSGRRFSCLELTKISDAVDSSISSILELEQDKEEDSNGCRYSTQSMTFSLDQPPPRKSRRQRAWKILQKRILFWRNHRRESDDESATTLDFDYDYDIIDITPANYAPSKTKTTGVLLIHPIGVGISRWFYQRLVSSLVARQARVRERMVVVVPDLLGSGSACNATVDTKVTQKFPLFNISDWTDQLDALMMTLEETQAPSEIANIDQWCVVANGGCSPIALQLAERKMAEKNEVSKAPVTNLILSSVPRLPFFLKNETTNDPSKVAKSYRTLSGIVGNLFWWYSCRNEGAFIQTFSEKNLIADPKNLGPSWRSNCYKTATSYDGRGKYATFSFLAGTLQDGCLPSLDAIKDSSLEISIIKGADVRRNRAKSWFWQKPKKQGGDKTEKSNAISNEEDPDADPAPGATSAKIGNHSVPQSYETFRDYVEKNGNSGKELVIGGRISLAHEDPDGYADALLHFLFGS